MAKTNEELKALKEEYERLKSQLEELNKEELKAVTGGDFTWEGIENQKSEFDKRNRLSDDWLKKDKHNI